MHLIPNSSEANTYNNELPANTSGWGMLLKRRALSLPSPNVI